LDADSLNQVLLYKSAFKYLETHEGKEGLWEVNDWKAAILSSATKHMYIIVWQYYETEYKDCHCLIPLNQKHHI
jgi:hypothetical protein